MNDDILFGNLDHNSPLILTGNSEKLNMCSLQQTPIFISWHFSRFHQTQDTKDAFWIKIQNLKKKIFFDDSEPLQLDSNIAKIQKSARFFGL